MITSSLKIMLWDNEIGRLSWDEKRGVSYFEYSKEFLRGKIDAFPLIASITSPASRLPIWGDTETRIYRRLPPFLADSLPDAWGNEVFECWRRESGLRNKEITPLDVLSFIGKRGMGALEFQPESAGTRHTEVLHLQNLTSLAHRIFREREKVKILPDESLTMQSLIAVGTSAGGRQPKAIVAINEATGEIRSGQIAGQKGCRYYILKFGDKERSSAELEMTYSEMASAAGIDMMPCRLIEVGGERHFITLRFDRCGERKLHMQTLAALYPEAESYEQLLMVCRKLRLPESAQEEVFRRMVFNVIANNTDDHNKNFSFLMDEQGRWCLSPAYDMTYIFNTGGYQPETEHCLTIRGKRSALSKADALAIAKDNGIRKAEAIIKKVGEAVSMFRTFAAKNGVKPRWTDAVESTLRENLEGWEMAPYTHLTEAEIDGILYSDIHVERTYKGNFHLYATTNGKQQKFVIGKNKADYVLIEQVGVTNLSHDQLITMVRTHLHKDGK